MKIRIGLLTALVIAITCLFAPHYAKAQDEPIVIVRVFESQGLMHRSEINITDGNEILNTLELLSFKPKNLGENARRIAFVLKSLKKEGYELLNVSASGGESSGASYSVTDYIFRKS